MNEHTPPLAEVPIGGPTSRRRWRRGLWSLPIFLPLLILATPAGQRQAVRLAIHQLDRMLPKEAPATQVRVGSVGLDHSPFGVALHGLEWTLAEGGEPLAQVETLTLQPSGLRSGRWALVDVEGARIQAAAFEWMDHLESNGEDTATSLELASLHLTDVEVALPGKWTEGVDSLSIRLTEGNLTALVFEGPHTTWQEAHARLEVSGQRATGPLAADVEVDGHPESLTLGVNAREGATDWAVSVLDSTEWHFEGAHLEADLTRQTASLRTRFDAGRVELDAAWTSDSLEFQRLRVKSPDLSRLFSSLPAGAGEVTLESRLPLAWSGLDVPPKWGTPQIPEAVTVKAELARSSGEPTSLEGTWAPDEGAIHLNAAILPDLFVPDHQLSLVLDGSVPRWSPEADVAYIASDWSGAWSIRTASEQAELDTEDGQIDVTVQRTGTGPWSVDFDVLGRCAPLALNPQLALFGDLTCSGQLTLDEQAGLTSWWTHVDLLDSRWIPQAGFGTSGQNGAPLSMRRLALRGRGDADVFAATLDGDFIQGDIHGPLDLGDWSGPIQEALASGGFADAPPPFDHTRDWRVDLTLVRDDLLERWSGGTQSVGPGSRWTGSHVEGQLQTRLLLTGLHVDAVRTGPMEVVLEGGTTALHVGLEAEAIRHAQAGRMERLTVDAAVSTGTRSDILVAWEAPLAGNISAGHTLEDNGQHTVTMETVSLVHDSGSWDLDTSGARTVQWDGTDWTSLTADEVVLTGPLGRVSLNTEAGPIGERPWLTLDADGVPAKVLPGWAGAALDVDLPAVDGTLNGRAQTDLTTREGVAFLQWQDATAAPYAMGDLCLDLRWGAGLSGSVQQFVEDDEVLVARLRGPHSAVVEMNQWPLGLLNPLLDKGGVALRGTADGEVSLDWEDGLPLALGRIRLEVPELSVEATGGQHAIQGDFRLERGFLGMDQALVTDPEGNEARLNLSVLHEDYAHWNYDLGIDIVDAPFRVMDLAPAADRLFHGTVYATGELDVFGDEHGVEIETALRSEAGTRFTLPLDALEGTDLPSGIQFVSRDEVPPTAEDRIPFNLGLDLDLDVTPDAELALVLDGKAGERVDGQAKGTLRIAQSPDLPLTVEGGIEIVEGQYRFSLRDLFTKRIDIAPGGRIDWDGDPYSAELHLVAFSSMLVNPSPLLPSVVQSKKTRVEVGLGIRGALEAPQLEFDIAFPEYEESDPAMLAEVQAALSTAESVERQAFALLATGQFIPAEAQGAFLSQTAAAQASELVSARVSEWLSGLSEDLDIGLRYVPSAAATAEGSDSSFEEAFELDLGLSLMNDRLQISGNVGAQGMQGFSLGTSEFRGGVDVRYRLTADGRWELQAYSIPESPLEEDPKQGIGAAYQLRFNRLSDLFRARGRVTGAED